MKPFNLEAALKGAPVITRSGRYVKVLGYLPDAFKHYTVVAYISGHAEISRFTECGRFAIDRNGANDLFMAPVKVRRWLNVFDQSGTETADLFDSEAAALRQADELRTEGHDIYTAVLPVEWEE